MLKRILASGVLPLLVVAAVAILGPSPGRAQQLAGVVVDADGVLKTQYIEDPTGQLFAQRAAAARAALPADVAAKSGLRKVSLNRLEAAVAKRIADGLPPTNDMLYLAGLTRVEYVFYYPDTKDIVLAGPAEGWVKDQTGRIRGIDSGRPIVELQDLAVALRMYPPGKKDGEVIGCSIDPTAEGEKRMQEFLAQVGAHATPNDTQMIVDGLRTSLGMQKVRILGVPPTTHFAQVMVEADYRMKLIGIGLEKPPIKLASYVDKANPAQVSRNALQRWYFTPDYQCVRASGDGHAMQLVGEGVKLVGQDEVVTGDGTRVRSGSADRASQLFVTGFTQKYAQLAAKSPVYAQLRNLIDLAVAAAFIQEQDYYGQAEWNLGALGDESQYAVETYTTPVEVETVVTGIWKGNRLMTPLGGGVHVEAHQALETSNRMEDEEGTVAAAHDAIQLQLANGQWWWD